MNPNNKIPNAVKRIYLMAICGAGMATLAGMFKELGYEVCGSDQNIYPPMSDELAKKNISVFAPYDARNLEKAAPDLVIVGNAVIKTNPEVQYLLETNIPYASMPQTLQHFFLKDKEVIVVAGTHGKTTTTALLAFLLERLGTQAGFFAGGVTKDFNSNFKLGSGKYFVIEGDEYDSAFFDKGPKFLHYNPTHVIMTSLEFDHADIYDSVDQITENFVKLSRLIPPNGSLHLCDVYPRLSQAVRAARARNKNAFIRTYGTASHEWKIANYTVLPDGSEFAIESHGKKLLKIRSPLDGLHNAHNTAACFSVLDHLGLDLEQAVRTLKDFQGVKRRQDVIFQDENFVVIDDFAHHPTEVKATLQAVRQKFKGHHLIAVFEPRSNTSRRNVFQNEYPQSFVEADETLMASVSHPEKVANGQILDVEKIVAKLRQNGKKAVHAASTQAIIAHIAACPKKPAVVLIMSNGGFDGIYARLINTLKNKP